MGEIEGRAAEAEEAGKIDATGSDDTVSIPKEDRLGKLGRMIRRAAEERRASEGDGHDSSDGGSNSPPEGPATTPSENIYPQEKPRGSVIETLETVKSLGQDQQLRKAIAKIGVEVAGSIMGFKFIKDFITRKKSGVFYDFRKSTEDNLAIYEAFEDLENSIIGGLREETTRGVVDEAGENHQRYLEAIEEYRKKIEGASIPAEERQKLYDDFEKILKENTEQCREIINGEISGQAVESNTDESTNEDKWEELTNDQYQKVEATLEVYLQTKAKKTKLIRESLNTILVSSAVATHLLTGGATTGGMFAYRGVMYAAMAVRERSLKTSSKFTKEKFDNPEDKKKFRSIAIAKDLLIDASRETWHDLTTTEGGVLKQGKLKRAQAIGVVLRGLGIAGLSIPETAEGMDMLIDALEERGILKPEVGNIDALELAGIKDGPLPPVDLPIVDMPEETAIPEVVTPETALPEVELPVIPNAEVTPDVEKFLKIPQPTLEQIVPESTPTPSPEVVTSPTPDTAGDFPIGTPEPTTGHEVTAPLATETVTPEEPVIPRFAHVEYQGGKHVWGEIDKQLPLRQDFDEWTTNYGDNEAMRTHLIDYMKDKIVAHPNRYGDFDANFDMDIATAEDLAKINWDKLFTETATAEELAKASSDLTPEQVANIVQNNEWLDEYVKQTGESIDSQTVDQLLADIKTAGSVEKFLKIPQPTLEQIVPESTPTLSPESKVVTSPTPDIARDVPKGTPFSAHQGETVHDGLKRYFLERDPLITSTTAETIVNRALENSPFDENSIYENLFISDTGEVTGVNFPTGEVINLPEIATAIPEVVTPETKALPETIAPNAEQIPEDAIEPAPDTPTETFIPLEDENIPEGISVKATKEAKQFMELHKFVFTEAGTLDLASVDVELKGGANNEITFSINDNKQLVMEDGDGEKVTMSRDRVILSIERPTRP